MASAALPSTTAIGLSVSGLEFGLAMLFDQASSGLSWTALQASATQVALVGVQGLTASASDLLVQINQVSGAGASNAKVIDSIRFLTQKDRLVEIRLLVIEELTDVLTVPIQAVTTVDGKQLCYRNNGGDLEPIEVEVGKFNTKFIIQQTL